MDRIQRCPLFLGRELGEVQAAGPCVRPAGRVSPPNVMPSGLHKTVGFPRPRRVRVVSLLFCDHDTTTRPDNIDQPSITRPRTAANIYSHPDINAKHKHKHRHTRTHTRTHTHTHTPPRSFLLPERARIPLSPGALLSTIHSPGQNYLRTERDGVRFHDCVYQHGGNHPACIKHLTAGTPNPQVLWRTCKQLTCRQSGFPPATRQMATSGAPASPKKPPKRAETISTADTRTHSEQIGHPDLAGHRTSARPPCHDARPSRRRALHSLTRKTIIIDKYPKKNREKTATKPLANLQISSLFSLASHGGTIPISWKSFTHLYTRCQRPPLLHGLPTPLASRLCARIQGAPRPFWRRRNTRRLYTPLASRFTRCYFLRSRSFIFCTY